MQIDHRCESAEPTTPLTRKSRATQHFENQCAHHRELTTKCWVGSSDWLDAFVRSTWVEHDGYREPFLSPNKVPIRACKYEHVFRLVNSGHLCLSGNICVRHCANRD